MSFNILLVDDSAVARIVMTKTFRLAQVPVDELYEAENGQEALKILGEHWIDVVFSDINMPVVDGIELVNRMSEDKLLRTIPIVLVSIEGSTTRIEQLKNKGVSAFIRKPFTPELLQGILKKVLWPRMRSCDRDTLASVFSLVLERFAFMFSENAGETPPSVSQESLKASIQFSGPATGEVVLAIPTSLGSEIASNVLGIASNDPVALERSEDAVKELLNVLCGQLLTTLAGETPVFNMTIPQVASLDPAGWCALRDDENTLSFVVESKPVLLSCKMGDIEK